ncbi:hypothetical protein RRF57_011817 [Xylaria bambusicola]|uniref:AAA+ ATPase domain-containing protein n=1 Tax=Xylaria bambusicola TaxID=326684 RepID=A0AAN7V351_9PEZI
MKQHRSDKIRYTVRHYNSAPVTVPVGRPVRTISQNKPPIELLQESQEDDTQPIIEIVCVANEPNNCCIERSSNEVDVPQGINTREIHMIVHSEALSQTIRNIVKSYPHQSLMGPRLIILEPYACLIHHMSDFERIVSSNESPAALEHVQVLMEFLRPRYTRYKSVRAQSAVRFNELWMVMKPGTMGYVDLNGYLHGCVIDGCTHLPANPSTDNQESWLIDFWYLRVDWPSSRIGCSLNTFRRAQFEGELPITSLNIFPAEFSRDKVETMQRFIDRGKKVYDVLFGDTMYMAYAGNCMDYAKQNYTGKIVIGGCYDVETIYPKHSWNLNWMSPSDVVAVDTRIPLSRIELAVVPEKDGQSIMKDDQYFILSPCLSAFTLPKKQWMPINVEHIRPLPDDDEEILLPIMDERKLKSIQALVDSNGCQDVLQSFPGQKKDGRVVIALEGPPGVGKTYVVEFIAQKSRRPIIPLRIDELQRNPTMWSALGKRWNAIFVDSTTIVAGAQAYELDNALENFTGTLFLTYGRTRFSLEEVSLLDLKITLPRLNDKARDLIWSDLERRLQGENKFQLHQNASKFLHSLEMKRVDWNGHAIIRCFKIAMALAMKQKSAQEDGSIIVEESHFKEAMNIEHEFNRGPMPPPPHRIRFSDPGRPSVQGPLPVPHMPYDFQEIEADPIAHTINTTSSAIPIPDELTDAPYEIMHWLASLSSDSDFCIPDLNRASWDSFQAAGKTSLFRKTKFYAIDILGGEPLIKLSPRDPRGRRRQNLAEKNSIFNPPTTTYSGQKGQGPVRGESGNATLPERIRINSPAIIRAFAEISDTRLTGPFLIFRPFRSLFYYEQEFRDALISGKKLLQDWSIEISEKMTSEEKVDNEIREKRLVAGLKQMECLLSFIDNELNAKTENLRRNPREAVPFADIATLFRTGDTVISKDYKQAYLVVNVTCARHRVKTLKNTRMKFPKDIGKVEFEDNPVRIHCAYVDFDGKQLGPVPYIFTIPRYDGPRKITSLPILPFRYVRENGLRERLIERGKAFFKVAGIRHMHYKGLTLKTRDEVDSQVVVDFDEAIIRNPEWKPVIKSLVEEILLEEPQPREPVPIADDDSSTESSSSPPPPIRRQSQDGSHMVVGVRRSNLKPKFCVDECCETEDTHFDEYVENWIREDYITSQMNGAPSTPPPVSIIPRDIREVEENNNLTDDEYLIMSFRVFGFVLRSRKWHELDMTHVFEVESLAAGEGFDELVLPSGHGDVVKSMIRQHLRERKLSEMNRDRTDVVRGKGKGLIMLLHGVPGVGKTSTAECVADLFRRPLFQITSGDLGTTAKEVEDSLEENFSLASRWNSVLLIDEADVFLAERTKEDFVRNSLVAVFLRMMEYYAGVLFLTTNRVGVFDEAFTSRIHISLYYPPLDEKSTLQIFEKNWDRVNAQYKKVGRIININISEITHFALEYYNNNKEGRWNGRQIRNAFQSALALAELDAWGTDDSLDDINKSRPVVLGRKSFDTVAKSYKGFTSYLKQVYGADFARRARENLWRFDAFGAPRMPNNLNTRLKIAEPTVPPTVPPTPGQWPGQTYAGYDPRLAPAYYTAPPPPQSHHYPEHYGHPGQVPRYSTVPTPNQPQGRDPRESWDSRPGPEGQPQ